MTGTPRVATSNPQESAPPRTRRLDIEATRIVAATLAVTIHATSVFITGPETAHNLGTTYWVALILNMASRCSSAVFFAIAGWVLLSRGPQNDEASWLGRRLVRLLVPLLLWNVIFAADALLTAHVQDARLWGKSRGPLDWLLNEATLTFAGRGTRDHLWFMYDLVAMTLVFWLLRVAPATIADRRLRLAAGGAAAMLVLPYGLGGAFGTTVSWASFGWVMGYAVLGYILISAPPPRRAVSAALWVGSTLALLAGERLVGYDRWVMASPGPLVMIQAIGVIGLVRTIQIRERWRPLVYSAAALTFGIFLSHPLVLDVFRLTIQRTDTPIPIVFAVTLVGGLVFSFGLVALWHRVRGLRPILG